MADSYKAHDATGLFQPGAHKCVIGSIPVERTNGKLELRKEIKGPFLWSNGRLLLEEL